MKESYVLGRRSNAESNAFWFAPIFQAYLGRVWTAFSPREGGLTSHFLYWQDWISSNLLTPRFSYLFIAPDVVWNSPFGGVFWFWPIKTCKYLGKHGACSSNSKFLTLVNTSSYGPRWSERHVACSKTCPPQGYMDIPRKLTWNPKNEGWEDESPFQKVFFLKVPY